MTVDDKLDAITKQLAELVHHVAEVRRSNVRLETDMKVMRKDMDTMRGDIDTMRGDIDAMRADIDAMRGDIDAMRADIGVMRGDIDSIQGDLRGLDDKIDDRAAFVAGKIPLRRRLP